MLRFFSKKLLSLSVKALVAPEIRDFSLVSILRCHLSRGIANGSDALLLPSDLNKVDRMTASYLMSSCGLSPKSALSVSKRFRLKSIENSESVIRLLKAYGVSEANITVIITKYPRLLKAHAEITLKPKLEFLSSVGFHGDDIASILAANAPLVLYRLEKIAGCFDFFSATLPSKTDVIQALKCSRQCLDSSCQTQYKILKDHGVADDVIVFLLKFYPSTLMRRENLLDAVRTVKDMGFPSTRQNFARAVSVIASVSKDGWVRRVKLLHEIGWSDEEILTMFKMMPNSLSLSDESIRARLKFYEEKVGWGPAVISKRPSLLTMNLGKRIMSRFLVLKQLMSLGLIPLKWHKSSFIISNQEFSKKYIDKYKAKAPVIVEYYERNSDVQGKN